MANSIVRHWRLIALALIVIAFLWVLYLIRLFVLPFAVGLVLAYLLMPLVAWLERRLPPRNKWPQFRRVTAIFLSFLLVVIVIGGFIYLIVTAVIDAASSLVNSTPVIIEESITRVQTWFSKLTAGLPPAWQDEVNRDLVNIGVSLADWLRSSITQWVANIPGAFKVILGFGVVPFFLFYILKDSASMKRSLVAGLPASISWHGRNVVSIVEKVMGRYIRAQLMLGLIVGYFTYIGLLLLGVTYPLSLALLAGIMEMVPTLGPWISGIIAVVVTLALTPGKAIWVALLFLGIQLVENTLLVPKVQSAYMRIHPAIMIVLLIFGAYVAGFWGIVLIGPLTATVVEIFKYTRNNYKTNLNME